MNAWLAAFQAGWQELTVTAAVFLAACYVLRLGYLRFRSLRLADRFETSCGGCQGCGKRSLETVQLTPPRPR